MAREEWRDTHERKKGPLKKERFINDWVDKREDNRSNKQVK